MRELPRAMALATACVLSAPLAATGEETLSEWARPMREVHRRFTGTPGTTRAMQPGDTFEVEVVGVTTLRNTVAAAKTGTSSAQR